MARYLFTVWSIPGHLYPGVAVANALRERGHDVAFYTGSAATPALAKLGITHFPMHHVNDEVLFQRVFPSDDSAGRSTSAVDQARRLRATVRAWYLDTVPDQLRDLEPILDQWQPDAIVCDYTILAPFLVLHEARSIPVAILSLATGCMLSGPDSPPWGRALPPPTTQLRRLRYAAERAVVSFIMRDFRRGASAIRAGYGLPPLTQPIIDFGGTMPLYLVTSVPELDYNRHDLPPSVHYVGPLSWSGPGAAKAQAAAEPPNGRPLVYVTEGTVQTGEPKLLRAAAQGLANLPMDVILKDARAVNSGQGDGTATRWLDSLPPNVHLETYTPGQSWQTDILGKASLVITNGGAGNVLAALSAGVPLVVVPAAWDKPENAQRVVEAGAGLRLSPSRCTPERLREAAQRVLTEPSFRSNARRLAAVLGTYDGPQRSADLLERLCAGRKQVEQRELAARQS